MNFALSEEQEQLRGAARDLLARECTSARVRKTMDSGTGHDRDLHRSFAEAGWLGILVPEEFGGAGLTLLDAAVLLGELGRAVVPGPFLASSVAATLALREGASRAQQRCWLPRIATGDAIGTLAFAEGNESAYDPAAIRTRARRSSEGFRIDGEKRFVDSAHVADLILVACRTGTGARRGAAALGLLALPAPSRGLVVEPLVSIDETRRPCDVRLRDARVDAGAQLVKGGRALPRVLDACAIALAADSLGGAERALELAVDYVKVREQFGRPVGSFQAVQHLAAEAVARIEPARSLLWYAAWAWDARPREAPLAAAMAKACCSDVFRAVTRTAVEMLGGIGFTWENDMHLYYKRALANASAFGDAAQHRERVAQLAGF